MRILLLVLVYAVTLFAEDPQAMTAPFQVRENVRIPARLRNTIDTRKCKAGDAVELRTLEPVLISNGLVMPENTKLYGKVVAASSRKADKPSWVLLVVQRAEWKDHSIPLHAFITSQIAMQAEVEGQNDTAFEGALNLPDNFYRRFSRTQSNPSSTIGASPAHPVKDGTVEGGATQELRYQRLDDVRVFQDKAGRVFLLSPKDHLKLPSGTMFLLHNRPPGVVAPASTGTAATNAH